PAAGVRQAPPARLPLARPPPPRPPPLRPVRLRALPLPRQPPSPWSPRRPAHLATVAPAPARFRAPVARAPGMRPDPRAVPPGGPTSSGDLDRTLAHLHWHRGRRIGARQPVDPGRDPLRGRGELRGLSRSCLSRRCRPPACERPPLSPCAANINLPGDRATAGDGQQISRTGREHCCAERRLTAS